MKGILLDASVTASWFLRDEPSDIAQQVLAEMQKGVAVFAPSLWLLEMTNVLFNAERRKRISREHRDEALEQMERLPITLLAAAALPDLRALRHCAEKHQLTAYDAEYLRVAKEQKLTLATEDGNLLAAARREKVPVVGAT